MVIIDMQHDIKFDEPLISIVTVVKNGVSFIDETIRSVLNQSYKNIQYIVIDGESDDGTVDIIKSHAGAISDWLSEPDAGIADAFNKGLKYVRGKYVLILNSDDALSNSSVIQSVVLEINRSNFPMLVYGDFDLLNRASGQVEYRGSIELSPQQMLRGKIIPHPCLFTNMAYFEKYGEFDTSFRIAMDFEWMLRGGLTVTILHLPLLVTNIRDGGVSTQSTERAVEEIIRALQKNGYYRSFFGGARLRFYFYIRSWLRRTLVRFGFYQMFFNIRNKINNG